jgi:thioredoxin 1
VIDLTDANWDSVVRGDRPVFVAFWAPWCGPCRSQRPTLEALAGHFGRKVVFARLNTDENPDICARHAVSAIPQVLLFRRGVVLTRVVGLQSESILSRLLYRTVEE